MTAIFATGMFASVGAAQASASTMRVAVHVVSGQAVHGLEASKATDVVPRVGTAVGYKFTPDEFRVPDCTNPKVTVSFTMTNDTAVAQSVDFLGSFFFTFNPGDVAIICDFGAGKVRFTVESDAKASLTVRNMH